MADPVLVNGYRAQVILQGKSGLPEDRYVTSWAFLGGTSVDPEDTMQNIADRLAAFWIDDQANGQRLAQFLSPVVVTGPNSLEVRVYSLEQAPPREPTTFRYELPAITSTNGLPSEVAVCGSFIGTRNLPRSRGRIYLGPLNISASATDGTTGRVRPHQLLMDTLAAALDSVKVTGQAGAAIWCILSQRDADMKIVTSGWVDDAFDTQRRRGEDPTGRVVWGTALP